MGSPDMRAADPVYGTLELVEWVDSQSTFTGWTLVDDIDPARPVVGELSTVGWVVRENDAAILIASSAGAIDGGSHQICHAMTIPKVAIVKRTRL